MFINKHSKIRSNKGKTKGKKETKKQKHPSEARRNRLKIFPRARVHK